MVASILKITTKHTALIDKQEIHPVELGVCPMQLFHFWSRHVHPVQYLLLCTKLDRNLMIFCSDMAIHCITIFKMAAIRRFEFWKFSFLIMRRSPSSKSAAVYKISWKSDYFSRRYGDITIFKMAAVRHLGIVLPPYETTHEVSVAGRSSLSNFMSIWYTDLKI